MKLWREWWRWGAESNTKPEYILGHSCQALAVLVTCLSSVAALPLAARIHEGVVFSNRCQRTLLDKMITLLNGLALDAPYYFVADAYYASRKVALPLLRAGQHLVTRVRHNAVGYLPVPVPRTRGRGRPRLYGQKVPLKNLFDCPDAMISLESPRTNTCIERPGNTATPSEGNSTPITASYSLD